MNLLSLLDDLKAKREKAIAEFPNSDASERVWFEFLFQHDETLESALREAIETLRVYANPNNYDNAHTARIGLNNECGLQARTLLNRWGVK